MKLKDNVVLITGSTRGIGKEIALNFAKEGAIVIICGTNAQLAAQTKDEITKKGFQAAEFTCDVTNLTQVEEMLNNILAKFNRIDILVNNAGITRDNLLLRMKESDWDDVMRVNLKGVFNCTKAVLKPMLKAKKGKIISIASIIGLTGNSGQANYAAAKAGVVGLSRTAAKELARSQVTVNAICPGFIDTTMTRGIPQPIYEQALAKIPLGRAGKPADVAAVVAFLASDDAAYIPGEVITVGGGYII